MGLEINGSPVGSDPIGLKDGDTILLGETVEIHVIEAKETNVVERQPEARREQSPDPHADWARDQSHRRDDRGTNVRARNVDLSAGLS